MLPPKDIAVIGGGPAGLMAAETLATAGHRVTIYDRMPTPARKFLIAGRGGLNLTHSEPLKRFLGRYGAAEKWLAPAIHAYPPRAVWTWCEGLGEETFVGSSGRIFPRNMKAVQLLRAWLRRLDRMGVTYVGRHHWQGFEGDALRFTNAAQETVRVVPDATLLALGGASWPRLGSDGGWVSTLRECGVEIATLRPSNCGFLVPWSEYFSTRFAGVPLKPVTMMHRQSARQGEAMITRGGIEGGVVYALSAQVREDVELQGKAALKLDLRPGMSLAALAQKLEAPRANKSFSTYLQRAGFPPLTVALLREVIPQEALTHASPPVLAGWLKAVPLNVTGITGLERAISSAGGIMWSAVDLDFMLHAKPGVFVAGEMLDWEAPTGGYLLQGCFSTAVAAARGMLRYCDTL